MEPIPLPDEMKYEVLANRMANNPYYIFDAEKIAKHFPAAERLYTRSTRSGKLNDVTVLEDIIENTRPHVPSPANKDYEDTGFIATPYSTSTYVPETASCAGTGTSRWEAWNGVEPLVVHSKTRFMYMMATHVTNKVISKKDLKHTTSYNNCPTFKLEYCLKNSINMAREAIGRNYSNLKAGYGHGWTMTVDGSAIRLRHPVTRRSVGGYKYTALVPFQEFHDEDSNTYTTVFPPGTMIQYVEQLEYGDQPNIVREMEVFLATYR